MADLEATHGYPHNNNINNDGPKIVQKVPTLVVGLLDFNVYVVLALQCPTAEYLCSAQPPSSPAVPNHKVSLQCPTAEYPVLFSPPILQETVHFLCNNCFRVGTLEVDTSFIFLYESCRAPKH